MAERAELTELEGLALGVLATDGPCTAYQVRRAFLDSPSPWFSGSAGALYPLLARLEKSGLVNSTAERNGHRRSRSLRLTTAGRRRLARWLDPVIPDWVAGVPMDPLRNRLGLLRVLSREQRVKLVAEAERAVREQLTRIEKNAAQSRERGDAYDVLIDEGALAVQRARLLWLGQVRRRITRDADRG